MQIPQLVKVLNNCWKIQPPQSVIILGNPGIGKTSVPAEVAEEAGTWNLIVKLPQNDPVDLKGLPLVDKAAETTMFSAGPIVTRCHRLFKEAGEKPGILTLDELGNTMGSMQTASYELFMEGSVGGFKLPHGTLVVGTSNKADNKAYTTPLAAPLANRCLVVTLEHDADSVVSYGIKKNWNPILLAGIKFLGNKVLYSFEAKEYNDSNYQFSTPRSIENLSRYLQASGESLETVPHEVAKGFVGAGPSAELIAFAKTVHDLPSQSEIMNTPKEAKIPKEPSALFAVVVAVASWLKNENRAPIIEYVQRLPREFQQIANKELSAKMPTIVATDEYAKWASRLGVVAS